MLDDQPRLFFMHFWFMHFWANDQLDKRIKGLRAAVDEAGKLTQGFSMASAKVRLRNGR